MSIDFEKHDGIKRALRARKITFVQIARDLGVTSGAVSRVCQGRTRSHRIQKEIAGKLGTDPSSLWPERYAAKEATMKK